MPTAKRQIRSSLRHRQRLRPEPVDVTQTSRQLPGLSSQHAYSSGGFFSLLTKHSNPRPASASPSHQIYHLHHAASMMSLCGLASKSWVRLIIFNNFEAHSRMYVYVHVYVWIQCHVIKGKIWRAALDFGEGELIKADLAARSMFFEQGQAIAKSRALFSTACPNGGPKPWKHRPSLGNARSHHACKNTMMCALPFFRTQMRSCCDLLFALPACD